MHSERPRRRRARPAAEASSGAVLEQTGITGGQYRPLANAEVWRIIDAACAVLEQTGIEVMPSPAREVFARAGALDARRRRQCPGEGGPGRALAPADPA